MRQEPSNLTGTIFRSKQEYNQLPVQNPALPESEIKNTKPAKTLVSAYTLTIFFTVIFLLFIVIGFNIIVDPYGMYGFFEIKGLNIYKPSIYTRVRLLKAYEVREIKPDSILLGSSRCHLAFNPSNGIWTKIAQRPYNLAFDGAATKEMYYFMLHANSVNRLKQVILGLDTYHPTKAPAGTRPDFDGSILMNKNSPLSFIKLVMADIKILTSFDTVLNSIKTIREQNNNDGIWLAPNGQRLGEVFFRRPYENFQKFGPRYYFDEIDKLEVKYKLEWKIPAPAGKKIYHKQEEKKDTLTSLDYIRKIVEFCRRENIDLKIFFTPSHARQLEISAAAGEWESIENGKRELVKILSEDAKEHPKNKPIPLFDFSGYSDITMEFLPKKDGREEMKFYWDSSHFKENIGDLVLERILNSNNKNNTVEDFGVSLNEENIEKELAHIRDKRFIYEREHTDDIVEITAMVKDFKEKNNITD